MKVIAVDWSGAKSRAERKIWLAEADANGLRRLEDGRDRDALADHLIDLAAGEPRLIAGFDFAFSLPAWFLANLGASSAPELWDLASREAERWLASRAPPSTARPFWGGGRGPRPDLPAHYRLSDLRVPRVKGVAPKSVFQAGGSGAVGTASLRGLPVLHRLRSAGFAVWPFDSPSLPLVVEIYPRVLTGPVNKSSAEGRRAFMAANFPEVERRLGELASSTDDAFDAAVSALVMRRALEDLLSLPRVTHPVLSLEGIIWYPGWRRGLRAGEDP